MIFFLGVHHPSWLTKASVPLFISRNALAGRRMLPRSVVHWALDSGGFTELSLRGGWTLSPKEYAAIVARYADEIGMLAWAAPQDWMCEPSMLTKTGLTIREHQRRTVANYLELKGLGAPVIPVLQGWYPADSPLPGLFQHRGGAQRDHLRRRWVVPAREDSWASLGIVQAPPLRQGRKRQAPVGEDTMTKRTPQDDITPRDLDGMPFCSVKSISVHEWHELPDGKGKPSQVHLWIELEGVEAPLVVRFKSPRGIDELIVALMTHRKSVWPIQVPSSDFRDDSQFEN